MFNDYSLFKYKKYVPFCMGVTFHIISIIKNSPYPTVDSQVCVAKVIKYQTTDNPN